LTEVDVLDMTTNEFKSYCGLVEYHSDAATGSSPVTTHANTRVHGNANAVVETTDLFTAQEF
jgi:hypothetical protein